MSRQAIDGLLERLYGMPQVGADWHPLLEGIGDVFRSHAIAFHSHDVLHQQGVVESAVGLYDGFESRFKALSNEHPWYIHGGEKLLREGMADDEGLLPEHEFYASRFYQEVMGPARIDHGLALLLHQDGPENLTLVTINRDRREGFYKPSERAIACLLLPHLRTAYLLQQRLGWMETFARTFRSALDRLEDGVVILDRRGVIRFANTAAERLVSMDIYHRCVDGRLRLPTTSQSSALHHYIRDSMHHPQPLSLRVLNVHGHWVATLKACPVDHLADWQWGEPEAGVMLFFSTTPTMVIANHRPHWQGLWGLTGAEADVAKHLAEGRSVAEAADALGVSINTVRTQLRALLAKTGARRQPDLVRMLILSHP